MVRCGVKLPHCFKLSYSTWHFSFLLSDPPKLFQDYYPLGLAFYSLKSFMKGVGV